MEKQEKIYVAGHEGMVGSTLMATLQAQGFCNIINVPFESLDLRDQKNTFEYLNIHRPKFIFLIAGKVGGINANIQFPGEYLYDNLMIAANVLEGARRINVKKLIFLSSSCIYPRECKQPMKEKYLLTGKLEPTNEGYAIGKIAGIKLCEYYQRQYGCNFISAIPPNLYGPKDNFSLAFSHVISALIQKIHIAKYENKNIIEIWGSGSARREFLFTKDLANGLIFLMNNYEESSPINIGSSCDVSIKELVEMISELVGFSGKIVWDRSKPDGMPRKLLDSSRINRLGWSAMTSLRVGLKLTYEWYKKVENDEI